MTWHSPGTGGASWCQGTRGPPQLRAEHTWGETHPWVLPLPKTLLRLPRERRPVDLKHKGPIGAGSGDGRDPALQIHVPRLPMAWGWREGRREGPTAPQSPPRPGLPPCDPGQDPSSWGDAPQRLQPTAGLDSGSHAEDGWSWPGRGWTCGWPGERVLEDSRERWTPSPPQPTASLGPRAAWVHKPLTPSQ